jgi:hypothetical protein
MQGWKFEVVSINNQLMGINYWNPAQNIINLYNY